jgi:predicted glycoside hydrolase/deacetylase ChbG (UPF0249 family)
MTRTLIVNADDFGLTPGVCHGILQAHERGVVSSTSALVVGPAFADHAASLRDSGLPVGGHLAIVGEDPPVLSAREIPTLVDRAGRFPLRWQAFVRRAARGGVDTDDIRREFLAQLELLEQVDIPLTHLDSHQNLHLWPQVTTVLLELAVDRSVPAIRLPRTGRWAPVPLGVRSLSALLRARAARAGLLFPDASAGLDQAGALDRDRFIETVGQLHRSRCASAELVTHLASDPDPERARYVTGYRWADELDAACDPAVRATIDRAGFRLGSYADLQPRRTPAAAAPPTPSRSHHASPPS